MKIRNGFVSNSSSSSFVLGYGKVVDYNALHEYLNENNISIDGHYLKMWDNNYENKWSSQYELSRSNYITVTIPEELRHDETIIAEFGNDEGDSVFPNDGWDIDYSCANDIEWYDKDQQAVIRLFSQPFIEHGHVQIGAERNG